jgi:hypothetical protein
MSRQEWRIPCVPVSCAPPWPASPAHLSRFKPVPTKSSAIASFPPRLVTDDPGINDELSFPTVSWLKNGDSPSFPIPSAKQLDISGEYSKRITEAFAISVSSTWTHLYGGPFGLGASGFQNLETLFKHRVYRNPEHEFVVSVGLGIEWGGSGAQDIGAERFTIYTPTVFFGKGFGDLPETMNWARPFAITGVIGYAIPGTSSTTIFNPDTGDVDIDFHPRVLNWGGTLQYSMPYLKQSVIDLQLPDFINHLIPIVEASFQTPVANTFTSGTVTTGTISPGMLWVGNYFQVGVEAVIPINRQTGTGVGVIAQLHLYLDDIDPRGIGKPIFGPAVQPAQPFPGIRPCTAELLSRSCLCCSSELGKRRPTRILIMQARWWAAPWQLRHQR